MSTWTNCNITRSLEKKNERKIVTFLNIWLTNLLKWWTIRKLKYLPGYLADLIFSTRKRDTDSFSKHFMDYGWLNPSTVAFPCSPSPFSTHKHTPYSSTHIIFSKASDVKYILKDIWKFNLAMDSSKFKFSTFIFMQQTQLVH